MMCEPMEICGSSAGEGEGDEDDPTQVIVVTSGWEEVDSALAQLNAAVKRRTANAELPEADLVSLLQRSLSLIEGKPDTRDDREEAKSTDSESDNSKARRGSDANLNGAGKKRRTLSVGSSRKLQEAALSHKKTMRLMYHFGGMLIFCCFFGIVLSLLELPFEREALHTFKKNSRALNTLSTRRSIVGG
jgi:hypothetical protein